MATAKLGDRPEKYLKTAGTYADGKGLYLRVRAPGQGSWTVKFGVTEKSLGPFDLISADEARSRHHAMRVERKAGRDPWAMMIAKAITEAASEPVQETFGTLLSEYLAEAAPHWRDGVTGPEAVNHRSTFAKVPALLALPVAAVKPAAIAAAVKVYADNPTTAGRMRKRIRTILRFGETRTVRGHKPVVVHHPSMAAKDIPALMVELSAMDRPDARAMRFTILTAARSGEVLGATWSEITTVDGQPVWIVPAGRVKASREHRVPLTGAALECLGKRGADSALIFVSLIGKKANLGHGAMQLLLKELRPGFNVHGFRSSFRDWLAEETDFGRDLGEIALAHAIGSQTERAYARGDQLEKRRPLMQAWAAFCSPSVPA
jgi:integrase